MPLFAGFAPPKSTVGTSRPAGKSHQIFSPGLRHNASSVTHHAAGMPELCTSAARVASTKSDRLLLFSPKPVTVDMVRREVAHGWSRMGCAACLPKQFEWQPQHPLSPMFARSRGRGGNAATGGVPLCELFPSSTSCSKPGYAARIHAASNRSAGIS